MRDTKTIIDAAQGLQFKSSFLSSTENSEMLETAYEYILKIIAPEQTEFKTILPTNWKDVTLDNILDPNNKADTDKDGLTDWEEADTGHIKWDYGGAPILPSVGECMGYAEKIYGENFYKRFISEQYALGGMPSSAADQYMDYIKNNVYVLPIFSDPTSVDSDDDGAKDSLDIYPLMADDIPLEFRKMYFENLITKETIYSTGDGFYVCMTSIEDILKGMNYDKIEEENENDSILEREYYDDWYVYAVINEKTDYKYSLVKLREAGDKQGGKISKPGMTVCFSELDMSIFHEYKYATDDTITNMQSIVTGKSPELNIVLAEYFADTKSKGSYLLGELYIKKVINESVVENVIDLKECGISSNFQEVFSNSIFYHGLSDPRKIWKSDYFDCPEKINVNKNNLTSQTRHQIIRYTLGSSSINSIAAEIQVHAIVALKSYEYISFEPEFLDYLREESVKFSNMISVLDDIQLSKYICEQLYGHSINADLSYGEDKVLSVISVWVYLEDYSFYTRKQREVHGYVV